VPLPVATRSYNPVPNGQLVDLVQSVARSVYDVPDDALELSLALSGKDQQMFGALAINADAVTDARFDSSMTIVFRNSYNKSLSLALAGGAHSWICSNLQISGEIIELRKHTTNIWDDLRALIERVVRGAKGDFQKSMVVAEALSALEMSYDDCYRFVGLALGHKVLRAQQAGVVFSELETPSHEEFRPMNAWSLYNHFTEGLKRSPAGEAMARHQRVTQFFGYQFALSGNVPPVPQFALN
jgi:hypothetical protein